MTTIPTYSIDTQHAPPPPLTGIDGKEQNSGIKKESTGVKT
jgi:hypothetical protein